MPQLDFNVLLNNFLLVLVFFIFFYLFLNFFFLRRIFSILFYRTFFVDMLDTKLSYLTEANLLLLGTRQVVLYHVLKIIKFLQG